LTCAGRRTAIVSAFKDALRGEGLVLACDASPDAPALQQADRAFIVPSVDRPDYIDALVATCEQQDVGLLIPALEPELPLLAESRARFSAIGTLPLVSPSEVVSRCYDKLETNRFLQSCGLTAPQTYSSLDEARSAVAAGEVSFPLVLKPRWGVSSLGLHVVHDDEELELAYRLVEKQLPRTFLAGASSSAPGRAILIQERVRGDEHGLDVINDLEGRHVRTLVKRKLRMRDGNTDRAVSVVHPELERIGRILGEKLGHYGLLDCDVFATAKDAWVIDLNPRIGGGYPFSHAAGANFPAALLAWVKGRKPDPSWLQLRPGITTSKCDHFLVKP
jgi:carbamoyl-phosphate synthase large subunit